MKKIPVVATKCLPTYLPISQTLLAFLAMDYWHASDLVRGIVYTVGGIIWAGVLFVVFNQETVDIFAEKRATDEIIETIKRAVTPRQAGADRANFSQTVKNGQP